MARHEDEELLDEFMEQEAKAGRFDMKRFFKSPEEAQELAFKEFVQKKLSKAMKVRLQDAPFFFVVNFKFADEPEAPFFYVGKPNAFWKQAIKDDYKRRNEFAMGTCCIKDADDGGKKLVLTVTHGKGQRDINLRLLNKQIFRRLSIAIEFAQDAPAQEPVTKKVLPQAIENKAVGKEGSLFNRLQEEVELFRSLPPSDVDSRMEKMQLVNALVLEFESNRHKTPEQKSYVKKVKEFMSKAGEHYNEKNLLSRQVEEFVETYKIEYLRDKLQLEQVEAKMNEMRGLGQTLQTELKKLQENTKDMVSNQEAKAKLLLEKQFALRDAKSKYERYKHFCEEEYEEQYEDLLSQSKSITQWLAGPGAKASDKEKKQLKDLLASMEKEKAGLRLQRPDLIAGVFDKAEQNLTLKSYAGNKAYDPQAIVKLGTETQLKAMEHFTFGSAEYKAVEEAYKKYQKTPVNELDMRRVRLGEIGQCIEKWRRKHDPKKHVKEAAQLNEMEKQLWPAIKKLSEFTGLRADLSTISGLHREFKTLAAEYQSYMDELKEKHTEQDDKLDGLETDLSKCMNKLQSEIRDWQSNYTNLQGFGTAKQNKDVEAMLMEVSAFVKQREQKRRGEKSELAVHNLVGKTNQTLQDDTENKAKQLRQDFDKTEDGVKVAKIEQEQTDKAKERQTLVEERQEQLKIIEQNNSDLELLKTQLADKEGMSDTEEREIRDKMKTLQEDNQKAGKTIAELDKKLKEKDKELEKLQSQADSLLKSVNEAVEELRQKSETQISENLRKTVLALAVETAKIIHPTLTDAQMDEALRLVDALMKSHKVKPEDEKWIVTQLSNKVHYIQDKFPTAIKDEALKLAKSLKTKEIAYNDLNEKTQTRALYDPLKDKVFAGLEKKKLEIEQMSLDKTFYSVTSANAKRLRELEKWLSDAQIWEGRVGTFYEHTELNKRLQSLQTMRKTMQRLKEESDAVQQLRDSKDKIGELEEKNKTELSAINDKKKQRLELEQKIKTLRLLPNPTEKQKEELAKLRKTRTEVLYTLALRQGRMLQNTLDIEKESQEWISGYDKVKDQDEFVKNEKMDRQKAMQDKQNQSANLNKFFRNPEDIKQKSELYTKINDEYKNGFSGFAYAQGDELSDKVKAFKLDKIEDVLDLIREWNCLVVSAKDEEEGKIRKQEAETIAKIQAALLLEKSKFEQLIVIRPDVFFQSIKKQYEPFKKLQAKDIDAPEAKAIALLERSIETWKNGHPATDGANDANYLELKAIERKLGQLKNSTAYSTAQAKNGFVAEMEALNENWKQFQLDYPAKTKPDHAGEEAWKELTEAYAQAVKEIGEGVDAAQKAYDEKNAFVKATTLLQKAQALYQSHTTIVLGLFHKMEQARERLLLAPIMGMDIYGAVLNIPAEDLKPLQNAALKAIQRARTVINAKGPASLDEARQMVEHVPVALWPDSFVEEMRLWQKAFDMYTQKQIEKAQANPDVNALTSFVNFAMDMKTMTGSIPDDAKALYEEAAGIGESGQFEVKIDGKTYTCDLFDGGLGNKKEKEEEEYKPFTGSEIAKKSIGLVPDVITTGVEAKKMVDLFKKRDNETPEEAQYRKVVMAQFIAKTTKKLTSSIDTFIKSTEEAPVGNKIASAVLKSVGILCDIFLAASDGAEEKLTLKQHLKSKLTPQGALEAAGTLLEVGAAVSDVVGIFVEAASVASAAFNLVSDIKSFIEAVHKAAAAVKMSRKVDAVYMRAVSEDHILKEALLHEAKEAKLKQDSAIVDAVSAGIEVVGSGLNLAGSAMLLAGEPEVVAAGAGLKVAAGLVKVTAKGIKIGKDLVILFKEEFKHQEMKRLLEDAKAGDRNARMRIAANSSFFAKAFIAVKVEEKDPLALEYCLVRGLTDKDFDDKSTAESILGRLFEATESSQDERTLSERIVSGVSAFKDKVVEGWNELVNFEKISIDATSKSIDYIKKETVRITAAFSRLKTLDKASPYVAAFSAVLFGANPLNILTVVDEYKQFKAYFEKVKENMQKMLVQFMKKEAEMGKEIAKKSDAMDDLLKKDSGSESDTNKALLLEEEAQVLSKFLTEVKNSIHAFNAIMKK